MADQGQSVEIALVGYYSPADGTAVAAYQGGYLQADMQPPDNPDPTPEEFGYAFTLTPGVSVSNGYPTHSEGDAVSILEAFETAGVHHNAFFDGYDRGVTQSIWGSSTGQISLPSPSTGKRRYYVMRGYRPQTQDFEVWIAVGQPSGHNPSGLPIQNVGYIAYYDQ